MAAATGAGTEVGRTVSLTRTAKRPRTPLQRAMDDRCRSLLWLAVGVPQVRGAMMTTALPAGRWLVVVMAATLGTFWMEARKLASRR